ncbi:hypothetical protein KBD75_01095 [Candidatus Woesebacteria bacterium]|nr:hypothetical protein [Candidatus Woesebacteria bacterium]
MLITHIISAILTLFICLYVWFKPTLQLRSTLRLSTLLSVGSGLVLSMDPTYLTRSFCVKLGIYLLIILLTEYRLGKTLSATITST